MAADPHRPDQSLRTPPARTSALPFGVFVKRETPKSSDPGVLFQKFALHHRAKATIAKDWDALREKWTLDDRGPPWQWWPTGRARLASQATSIAKSTIRDWRNNDEDCAIIGAVAIDKLRIIQGQPTRITETVDPSALANRFSEIAWKDRERTLVAT